MHGIYCRICCRIYLSDADEYVYSSEYTAICHEYSIFNLDIENIHVYSGIFWYILKKYIYIHRGWCEGYIFNVQHQNILLSEVYSEDIQ